MTPTSVWITLRDGLRLAADLYLPEGDGPFAPLLEALPYRKDDLTAAYRPEYERLVAEGGFAVCRVDVRGTGSSEGDATDEYPESEQRDLAEVIAWLAAQPWSNGRVGMFGTSYSGFNSIQMACERPPALDAICAIYATDDRYTDDVHYMGGALRAIDLVDYCHYMTPMNALPPVPALFGPGWRDEWRRRRGRTPSRGSCDGCVSNEMARTGGTARSARTTSGSRAPRCWSAAGPTATGTTRCAPSPRCAAPRRC